MSSRSASSRPCSSTAATSCDDRDGRLAVFLWHPAPARGADGEFRPVAEGRADTLIGFDLSWITIADPDVVALSGSDRHPLVTATGDPGDTVEGMVFRVTPAEIEAADAYEVDDYVRVEARLKSGLTAFVYVNRPGG